MRKIKYFVVAVGTGAALLMAGCGLSAESDSSAAYESSVSGSEDTGEILAEGKDGGGEDETAWVEDDSWQLRQNAAKGSLDTFCGKYQVKDADGVIYFFDGDNTCYYIQQGTYSFSHDLNADGAEADMISMQFDTQSAPVNYTIEDADGQLTLRTTYSGDQGETSIGFDFVKGSDQLTEMEPFEGIYKAFDTDGYRYEFHGDGTFYLVLEEEYSENDATLTLSAFGKELTYDYAAADGNMKLSSGDVVIAELVPCE